MDSYIVISIYREPPLLLLAPSRLLPTAPAKFEDQFTLRAVDLGLKERITGRISHRCKRSSLFFEPFNLLFYLGNYFFVPNLFSFPDLG
jgi:hypothetical protein